MKYDKLVRDRIPEIIEKKGEIPVTRIASDDEYWQKLKEKLKEEVDEFVESGKSEEIADILEVIHAICEFRNVNKEELEVFREKKAEERGKFKKKIILDEVKK